MDTREIKTFTPVARGGNRRDARYTQCCELLKLPQRGKALLDAINKEFSVELLRDVAGNLAIDVYKMGTYIDIKAATLNRRLREGALTAAESEVYDAVLDLCGGDKVMAYQWLHSSAVGLSGEMPISLIRTSTGSNDVLLLISKIERGVLT